MIRIAIAAHELRYEFTWEGNEKAGRASIEYFEKIAREAGELPDNAARGILHHIAELLERADGDLPPGLKAGIVWYVLNMPTPQDDRRVLQRLASDWLANITVGGTRAKIETTIEPHPTAH